MKDNKREIILGNIYLIINCNQEKFITFSSIPEIYLLQYIIKKNNSINKSLIESINKFGISNHTIKLLEKNVPHNNNHSYKRKWASQLNVPIQKPIPRIYEIDEISQTYYTIKKDGSYKKNIKTDLFRVKTLECNDILERLEMSSNFAQKEQIQDLNKEI